jgi:hypothetical protein
MIKKKCTEIRNVVFTMEELGTSAKDNDKQMTPKFHQLYFVYKFQRLMKRRANESYQVHYCMFVVKFSLCFFV